MAVIGSLVLRFQIADDKNPSVNGFSVNGDSGRGDEDLAIFYTADYSYNSEIKNCSKKEFFTFPLLSK